MNKGVVYLKFGLFSIIGILGMFLLKDKALWNLSLLIFILSTLIYTIAWITPSRERATLP